MRYTAATEGDLAVYSAAKKQSPRFKLGQKVDKLVLLLLEELSDEGVQGLADKI